MSAPRPLDLVLAARQQQIHKPDSGGVHVDQHHPSARHWIVHLDRLEPVRPAQLGDSQREHRRVTLRALRAAPQTPGLRGALDVAADRNAAVLEKTGRTATANVAAGRLGLSGTDYFFRVRRSDCQ
jgi:hypothetical protein